MGIAKTVKPNLTNADINAAGTYTDNIAPVDGDTIASVPSTSSLLLTAASFWIGTGAQTNTTDVLTSSGYIKVDYAAGGRLRAKGQMSYTGTGGNQGQLEVLNGHATNPAIIVDTGVGQVYAIKFGTTSSTTQSSRLVCANDANVDTVANHWCLIQVQGTGSIHFPGANLSCGQIDNRGGWIDGKVDNGANIGFNPKPWASMTTQFIFRFWGRIGTSRGSITLGGKLNGRDIYDVRHHNPTALIGSVDFTNTGGRHAVLDAAAGGVRQIIGGAVLGSFVGSLMGGFTFGTPTYPVYFDAQPTFAGNSQQAGDSYVAPAYIAVRATSAADFSIPGGLTDPIHVWYVPNVGSVIGNNHGYNLSVIQSITIDGAIFDGTYVDGSGEVTIQTSGTPTAAVVHEIKNCIALYDSRGKTLGAMINSLNSNALATWRGKHNTYACVSGTLGGVAMAENNDGSAGKCEYWTDALVVTGATGNLGGTVMFDSGTATTTAANYCTLADYNAIEVVYTGAGMGTRFGTWNQYEADNASVYATTPGVHDVLLGAGGAQLPNVNANLASFYRFVKGGTPAAEQADDFNLVLANWRLHGTAAYDSTLSFAAYRTYRRNQAKPLNKVLWLNPGSDGLTRGAVQMDQPPTIALSSTLSPVAFSGTVGGGNPSNQTVTVTNGGSGTIGTLSLGATTYGASEPTGWLTVKTLGSLGGTPETATITLGCTTGSLTAATYHASFFVLSSAANCLNGDGTVPSDPSIPVARVDVTFTVGAAGSTITGISVSPTSATKYVGQTQAATATVTGTGAFSTAASWSSLDTSIATVVSTGNASATITAVAPGTVTIRAASTQTPATHADITFTVQATPPPQIAGTTSGMTFALNYGAGTPSAITRPLTDGTITPVTGLTAEILSWGAKEPTGWLAVTVDASTMPTTLRVTPQAGVGAGLFGPRLYNATARLAAPGAANVDFAISMWIAPQDAQAIYAPVAVARRADTTVIPGAAIAWSVDRTDIVACDGTTGLCFGTQPVADDTTITGTAASGGHSDTDTFTYFKDGVSA